MTALQRQRIAELRAQNYPYRFIAEALGISMNTVKSICRRQHLPTTCGRKTKAEKKQVHICKNCYRFFTPSRQDGRLFCSEACRREWWKANRNIIEK